MNAFLYGAALQWKLDLRNKRILITYYLVPLIFFFFMGGIFTSINPAAKNTLIQSMTVFGVTMGAFLGAPTPLTEIYGSEIKKAFRVGGIPLWAGAVNNLISAFIHLFLMSVIVFLAAPPAFHAKLPSDIPGYFASLAIFILVSLSVGTVLGLLFKSASKLTMASQLIFLPSIMISGIMFPASMLPKALQTVSKILPATWGFQMMTRNAVRFADLFPLLLIAAAMVCVSVYRLVKLRTE